MNQTSLLPTFQEMEKHVNKRKEAAKITETNQDFDVIFGELIDNKRDQLQHNFSSHPKVDPLP